MDAEAFRRHGKEIIDFVADYLDGSLRSSFVAPDVEPGYLKKLLPQEAPIEAESFADVMNDVKHAILPGVMHWHNPNFHAYFPSGNSYPTICAEILSATIGGVGFSWASNPACTELEVIMMDWLGKMLQLPEEFLSGGKGGGVIQGTASEATLIAQLGARSKKLRSMKKTHPTWTDADVIGKLITYCSDQAHSSVERACLLNAVRCHKVPSNDLDEMTGEALEAAIKEDKEKGLIPFFVVATLGTTPSCTFDHLKDIGLVCQSADVWLHIDAAYAGSAFICPEFRPLLNGVEWADSFNFNPHKWLLINFDCSAMWMKDCTHVVDTFNVDPLYLKHQHQGEVPDYRHWQIQLGRRFGDSPLWCSGHTTKYQKASVAGQGV